MNGTTPTSGVKESLPCGSKGVALMVDWMDSRLVAGPRIRTQLKR